MNETKRFLIKVTERTTTDGTKKFNTYKTFSKNGRAVEVKFRQEVAPLPKEDCYIECAVKDVNLNTTGQYPVMWVRGIERIIPREEIEEENAEKNREKLNEWFGE